MSRLPVLKKTLRIFTVGHSNRSPEEFLSLLRQSQITAIADIRRYPGSRKFPHFNSAVLRKLLPAEGIEYLWFEALGGRRHTSTNKESPDTGLNSPAFRNYADHMATHEFHAAVQELLSTAGTLRTSLMCAERFYWKCHRRLLSDYLTAQGANVEHIIEPGKLQPHKLTAGAVITPDAMVIYPSQTTEEPPPQDLFVP
ncbi:MAG: DUF488 domain-containing protein [Planctomycetota bacterium]